MDGGKLMMYVGAGELHSYLDVEKYYNSAMKNGGPGDTDQVRLQQQNRHTARTTTSRLIGR
jgi:hypothetical protein